MASLTQVSIFTRRIIRFTIYAVIFIIIARFSIRTGVGLYRRFFPKPPPPSNAAFGKLPRLPFPPKNAPEGLSFVLETPDGTLPSFPEQIQVYFMPAPVSNIGVLENAKEIAISFGFNPEGSELVETVYVFESRSAPSLLTMNIVTGVFSISFDLNSDPSVTFNIPPTPDTAITKVTGYLSAAGLFPDDISQGPAKTEFLRIESRQFVSAISLSEADLIKVNLFRKGIKLADQEILSVTPDPYEANIWFLMGGVAERGRDVIAAEYHYFPIDFTKVATYPLKSSQKAWEELIGGKGYIANLGKNDSGKITVRRVYLGYYDAGQYTEYYQPVAVFEGDNNFVGYVVGVTDEFYGE